MPAGLSTAALARFNKLFTSGVAYRTALALAADADTLGTGGGGGTGTVTAVNGKSPVAGVVTLVKGDIGLANVDNTPDATKPVSTPTTAAISAAINALVNSAPGTMDTLGEIAALLASDETTAGALATTVAGKMAKAANGSDIVSPSAFRAALGLGTAAVATASSFDAAGAATTAQANAQAASDPSGAAATAQANAIAATMARPTFDVLANRPAAAAAAGRTYQVTDDPTLPSYYSDGVGWHKLGVVNRLIERVDQRTGALAITTTAMTTWPGIILNVPPCDSDVEIFVEFPYRIYQNGVTTNPSTNFTLTLQLIDDLGTIKLFDVLAARWLPTATDAFAILENVYRKSVLIDKTAALRAYQMQFQISLAGFSVFIDPTFSGVGGLSLEALAVD